MKTLNPGNRSAGIAIIIVMVSIFILALLAGGFAYSMKVETKLAMNSNDENDLEWLGRSGVEMARYVLGQQLKISAEPYDSLNQLWAGGPGSTNALLADISLQDIELGKGKISIKITDAERRFNINMALGNEELLQQAFVLIGVDAADVPTIVASIDDWIDRDDDTRINGAERDYYESLTPPYEAKNGPIDDLSEMLFIKGITPGIYWGANSTNHPASMLQPAKDLTRSGLLPTAALSSAGLVDIFTPVSSGKINVNTASLTALQMIPGVNEGIANEIIRFRAGPDGVDGTDDDQPFRSLPEVVANTSLGQSTQGGQVPQSGLAMLTRFGSVRSTTFEVQVDVSVGQSRRTYFALLFRNNPNDVEILNMHWTE